jgi:hypothetical protein
VQAQRLSTPQPKRQITVSNGSSRELRTRSSRARAWSTEMARPSSLRTRGATESAAAFRETKAFPLGLFQSTAKYGSNDADRVGAISGVALPGEELINIGDCQLAQSLSP